MSSEKEDRRARRARGASSEPPLTRLSEVLEPFGLEGDRCQGTFPPDWAQGRTVFGGLTTAAALHVLRRERPELPPLRAAQVQFVAPVAPGEVELRRRLLREGNTLVQQQVEVWQANSPRVLVQASYGYPRDSAVRRGGPPAPEDPGRESVPSLEYVPPFMPTFMRHVDYRFTLGSPPVTGAPIPLLGGWFRLRDPGRIHREPLLAILVDAWPSPGLAPLRKPAPGSTLAWALYPAPDLPELDPGAWYRFRAESPLAGQGFVTVEVGLWSEEGSLLSIASQMDVIFG